MLTLWKNHQCVVSSAALWTSIPTRRISIYELLQNADDVRATSVSFRLDQDGLYFIHNGSIHFSVSDPHCEGEDAGNGALGHINSITSIANSSKTEASIGKFGVGFKAVFQYTQTPHIYDPEFVLRSNVSSCRRC